MKTLIATLSLLASVSTFASVSDLQTILRNKEAVEAVTKLAEQGYELTGVTDNYAASGRRPRCICESFTFNFYNAAEQATKKLSVSTNGYGDNLSTQIGEANADEAADVSLPTELNLAIISPKWSKAVAAANRKVPAGFNMVLSNVTVTKENAGQTSTLTATLSAYKQTGFLTGESVDLGSIVGTFGFPQDSGGVMQGLYFKPAATPPSIQ